MITLFLMLACNSGDADDLGIAAECGSDADCPGAESDTDAWDLECLEQFAGGYCGQSDCADTSECPPLSVCVTHDDGENYCFRSCDDKAECNANREDDEANCSSNFVWADPDDDDGLKACIPPSSGD